MLYLTLKANKISIHAPHEGERLFTFANNNGQHLNFNPRSPRGGATFVLLHLQNLYQISIHAPHEGERRFTLYDVAAALHISIHAPHEGERHGNHHGGFTAAAISIHAPHEGERQRRRLKNA